MTPPPLPRITPGARFVPTDALEGRPHVAVDCAGRPGTVLALSHWPAAATPSTLEDDTSALIADRYLGTPPDPAGEPVATLTCDHYDEDGLMALWLLLERPPAGGSERALALAAAEAGDFGTWTEPAAAQVAIAAMRMAERDATPFPDVTRLLARAGGRDPAGALYLAILPRVAGLLDDPQRFRMLWRADWRRIQEDAASIDAGATRIAERPGADLAVVACERRPHDLALHPRTRCMRILTATPDGVLTVRHRYETWVRYVSRPLAPRVDLTPLARRLQELERNPGAWVAEDMSAIRPMLYLRGPRGGHAPSSIGAERLADELERFVAEARPGRER
jgi:hypothetical protein